MLKYIYVLSYVKTIQLQGQLLLFYTDELL
jgi:hypothetical protein